MKGTVHFETLGCRLNQDETEGAARAFSDAGFFSDLTPVSSGSEISCGVILSVVNTCTVTGKAEQKARRIIRLLLEKFPEAPLIVTGCYAELGAPELLAISPGRLIVIPGTQKYILKEIAAAMNGGELDFAAGKFSAGSLLSFVEKKFLLLRKISPEKKIPAAVNPFALYTPVFEKHSRATLKIQDGCNNSCSFCAIHFARGASVSLEPEKVLERAREIEKNGIAEIVLTGVNLSQYAGKTESGDVFDFKALLLFLLSGTEKVKFRISSFYPQHITEDLCRVLADRRIQPFFHLSIQSGSDSVLHSMRRPYSRVQVENAVFLLRKFKELPFISCDIIAGFPGETESDFEQTKALCEKLNFAWIHAFPFSPRPGTEAFSMPGKIPERIKTERVKWLSEIAVAGKISYIKSFAGKNVGAIVEKRISKTAEGKTVFRAVTENFLHVEFQSEKKLTAGTAVRVKIGCALESFIRSGKETDCSAELIDADMSQTQVQPGSC
ncbi:tRNA (N(6)-L-threonylcarbamoyladenosine(37)-C(2))-methylthiotransferase MtaB [Treponema sp.]|uniref:tRNA (N(6)-L-threonylcarbamoyladenosine(37)-C(2))- methylthiotransferase MtaB n=1 Tax=Treponema sp. TaxID=166 RepID=UPI003F0278EE